MKRCKSSLTPILECPAPRDAGTKTAGAQRHRLGGLLRAYEDRVDSGRGPRQRLLGRRVERDPPLVLHLTITPQGRGTASRV